MKVRLMQRIDYWVGIPACFLLSIVNFFAEAFSKTDKQEAPKKILFIELSEMGSAIIAYSAIKKVVSKVGADNTFFLIFKKNRESVDVLEQIPLKNVLVVRDNSFILFAIDTLKMLFRIRSLQIDTAIDMELFSRFTSIFSFLCGAKHRVGFNNYTAEGLYRGSLITRKVFYNPHQHMSLNFLALVLSLEAPKDELPLLKRNVRTELSSLPIFEPTAEIRTRMWSFLSRYNKNVHDGTPLIVLNPDPGDALPIRGWPLENFVSLAKELLKIRANALLVIIGLPRSKSYAKAIIDGVGAEKCIDLTGETKTLKEVLEVLSIATVLITNDSGPAHLASLTKIHSVSIFGPETPLLYGPLGDHATTIYANYSCSPCLSAANHRRTICSDNKCLQAINVREVLDAVVPRL